jgi:hypothetical protein
MLGDPKNGCMGHARATLEGIQMNSLQVLGGVSALALAISGCSTWDSMGHTERGTAVGADEYNGRIASAEGTRYPPASDRRLSTSQGTRYDEHGNSISAYEQNARVSQPGYASSPEMATTSSGGTNVANAYSPSASASNLPPPDIHDRSLVRSVQQALNEDGYNAGPVDGIIGPRTSGALREFQDANGMPPTGRINSATVAALGIAQPHESSITGSNVTPYRSASTR